MSRAESKPTGRTSELTRTRLLEAAAAEFNTQGFHGTDTNRIARAAGFAPQTFYRHFEDKLDAFIRVYQRWQDDGRGEIAAVLRRTPAGVDAADAVAAVLLKAHRDWRVFRRSLRLLAVEDPRVRAARAAGRLAQLGELASMAGDSQSARPARVAALLTVERLCDAAADAEIADLGVAAHAWRPLVAEAVRRLREAR